MKRCKILLIGGVALVILFELAVLSQEDSAPILMGSLFYAQKNIDIEVVDHRGRSEAGAKPFSKYEGEALGLDKHNNFSVLESFPPASRGRGIASGDFNNDGWQDILLGTSEGLLLYKNTGSYKFALQDPKLPALDGLALGVHVAAFVDIDNDGWQDIYLTTYGGKNYFLLNDKKGFKNPKILDVPNSGALLTSAVSFGDLDKDGDLDFVNGNWTFSSSQLGPEANKLVRNNNLQFAEEDLAGVNGQTLSVLLADFTNDGRLDLIAGDEFDAPDNFYRGDGEGGLREIRKSDGVIPVSAHFNMGVDAADFNNDLYVDIYVSGVSTYEAFTQNPCPALENVQERQKCEKNIEFMNVLKDDTIGVDKCADLATTTRERNQCSAMTLLALAHRRGEEGLCREIPRAYMAQRLVCMSHFLPYVHAARDGDAEAIPQISWQNVLLQGREGGVFEEVSKEKNVHNAYNSWNAKFADLDNDEWQDIYVATGESTPSRLVFQQNVFFHNYGGEYFQAEQKEFGLEDFGIVPSYTYIDIDNDGDLDIISVPINEPLKVYINNEAQNNSITFEFRDHQGNHFGIGNKIYIYYGENNERHQIREIKSGGGFLSFDAPIAHFGLGRYDTVNYIEIVWSTGEKTTIEKEFAANKKYVITRKNVSRDCLEQGSRPYICFSEQSMSISKTCCRI